MGAGRDEGGARGAARGAPDEDAPSRRRGRWGVATAVAVVLVAVTIGSLVWGGRGAREPAAAPSPGPVPSASEPSSEPSAEAGGGCPSRPEPTDEFLVAVCAEENRQGRGRALAAAAADTGFSIGLDGAVPTEGYMVSFGDAPVVELPGWVLGRTGELRRRVEDYLLENRSFFAERTDAYLGGWVNPETGRLVIEVSERHLDRDAAMAAGAERDQIAIYDLAEGADILVDPAPTPGR
ncbi:hypothetical protein [Actinoalloteichus caeruleus]|uniref:hypothetical protein n=1 Tax=Actinoalloteichus cyanogriseus TaxID=2893586 RepID=UPI0012DC18F7|nr:hypothetical protein [Actinoalloteichus caeruleus]